MTAPGGRQVLLDTSVVIAPPLLGLASIADFVAVSAITVAELEFRVGAAADPVERQRRRRREQLVVDTFDHPVRHRGGGVLRLAGEAERHGLSLATRNAADFRYLERVLDVVEVP